MFCTGVNCGDLTGRKYSKSLAGALSTKQDFFYVDMIVNDVVGPEYKHEGVFGHQQITSFIPNKVVVDNENDILVTENGAIADAYDLNGLDDKELAFFKDVIIKGYKELFPGYEFSIMPGNFPLGVNGSVTINEHLKKKKKVVMSSHILYITNYKNHLENNKVNIKR